MELEEEPKALCNMLIEVLKRKFDYELNSPIYQVS
jgi:hypothetical protein